MTSRLRPDSHGSFFFWTFRLRLLWMVAKSISHHRSETPRNDEIPLQGSNQQMDSKPWFHLGGARGESDFASPSHSMTHRSFFSVGSSPSFKAEIALSPERMSAHEINHLSVMLTQDFHKPAPLFGGCSLQKWSESPLKGDTPLLINQGFIMGVSLGVSGLSAVQSVSLG